MLAITKAALLGCALALLGASEAKGGSLEISSHVIGGGGGRSSGGSYGVSGTIGQSTAGTITGGAFALGGGFWRGGAPATTGVEEESDPGMTAPLAYRVYRAMPNPFRATRIGYVLPAAEHVRMEVFNVRGERVAVLVDEQQPAGRHVARWDGRRASGVRAAPGIYIVKMASGSFSSRQKIALLR